MTQDQPTDEREALLSTSVQDGTSKSVVESGLPSLMPTLYSTQRKLTSPVSSLSDDTARLPHDGSSGVGGPLTPATGGTVNCGVLPEFLGFDLCIEHM